MIKKSPLARAEGCVFFAVARLVCLHIDLPFAAPLLSQYGFFGSALTSSLTLSHLDLLPTPKQQTQTAARPSARFSLYLISER